MVESISLGTGIDPLVVPLSFSGPYPSRALPREGPTGKMPLSALYTRSRRGASPEAEDAIGMRAIVVGGAGAMGRVAVADLAASEGVELVTVADLDADRAGEVAAWASGRSDPDGPAAEVRSVAADIASPSFASVLRGHDVCIASVAYRFNPAVASACLEAGCHYVDLGGLFHVARETLGLDDRFHDAGLTGVTCVGGSPGITNLLAVVGARELDPGSISAIHVRLGAVDPSSAALPLPIPYSLDTILDEFTTPAMAYRDGQFVEVPPLGEPEGLHFPPPIGRQTAVTTLHSEVATLPLAFPGVREVTFKITFDRNFIERFRLLADIGLASIEPLDVGGAQVRPRDVLAALGRRLPQAEGVEDTECLRVTLTGSRKGVEAIVVAESLVESQPERGLGAGARDTGVPPSVVAQMIVAGEVRGPGMFSPETAVDPDRFFARLAERGIGNRVEVQT
jgi:lysine 6-dehydrogenase